MTAWYDLIKRYRRVNGLTQAVFAELVGVEQATVSRWERCFHEPDLHMQRRLRELICLKSVASDQMFFHRVRGALSATKLADCRGRNHAASRLAAILHGIEPATLQTFDYTPLHTEILRCQWRAAYQLGFFNGDVASIRVFNPWQPACGGALRYCEGNWTPVLLSHGEVMLISEFREIDELTFAQVSENERFKAVMIDDLLE